MTDLPPVKLRKGPGPDPTRGIYGFVIYLSGFFCFGLYLTWAYIPPDALYSIGLTYWPQRYWAVALPVYMSCIVVMFFVLLFGYNLITAEPIDSLHSLQDERQILNIDDKDLGKRITMPVIADIPIDVYNRRVYCLSDESR